MKRNLRSLLDREVQIPDDVPHWIVEYHNEFDERDGIPLDLVKRAAAEIKDGHCWTVCHVRSGLQWSVDLGREEVLETSPLQPPQERA
jgi:hypothetical protein